MKSRNTVPSEAKQSNVWMRSRRVVLVIFIVNMKAEYFIYAYLKEDLGAVWAIAESQSKYYGHILSGHTVMTFYLSCFRFFFLTFHCRWTRRSKIIIYWNLHHDVLL